MATAAAAVAGFNDNEIDLAFARYRANADGKRFLHASRFFILQDVSPAAAVGQRKQGIQYILLRVVVKTANSVQAFKTHNALGS